MILKCKTFFLLIVHLLNVLNKVKNNFLSGKDIFGPWNIRKRKFKKQKNESRFVGIFMNHSEHQHPIL